VPSHAYWYDAKVDLDSVHSRKAVSALVVRPDCEAESFVMIKSEDEVANGKDRRDPFLPTHDCDGTRPGTGLEARPCLRG
jgi:hypothetical protein